MNSKWFRWLFVGTFAGLLFLSSVQAASKALTPVDRKEDWWIQRQAENVERMNKGNIEFLLIGASNVQHWDRYPDLCEKFFGEYKPINLGFGGDQTQHVLWRLEHLPLDKISPKAVMIMVGSNNVGHENGTTPKEGAEGIVAIVKKLQEQYPQTQIIVMKVFPRDEKPDGKYRLKVNELNSYLPAMLKGLKNVELMDINAGFIEKDGTILKSVMDDFLHPGREGYEYWGNQVVPVIKKKVQLYDRQTKPLKKRRGLLPPLRGERLFQAGHFDRNQFAGQAVCSNAAEKCS